MKADPLLFTYARRRPLGLHPLDIWAMTFLLLAAAFVLLAGITWGLPSDEIDPYLFGSHEVWPGDQIDELNQANQRDTSQGADIDANPIADRDQIVILNRTDAQRAEILRRYRLFTYQPDEMVTMMALASMSPGSGDFDPKLYQYGGLWIYPIGGLLQVASKLGFITLTGDLSFYLDNPQAFGRFYLVARLYVVAWAVIGVWVVYQLTLRLSGRRRDAAVAAGLLFIVLPIVVNMSHEAKPHLPGAVLMLATCLAAIRYTQSLDARWWWSTTILAGAAMSMVLSAWPGLLILPVALLLTRQPRRHRVLSTIRGWLVSGAVYVIWNPYVLLNLAWNRERLISNLANTRDMFTFGISLSGISNGLSLVTEGTGVIVPIVAVACLLACSVSALARFERRPRSADHPSPAGTAVLGIVLVPAGVNLLQFMLFAVEQPGEYARFALFFDLVLALVAVVLVGRLLRPYKPDGVLLLPLLAPLMALPGGSGYLRGFVADVKPPTTRTRAADLLEDVRGQGARSLAVFREPAPYCLPPVNLFDWEIVLLPDALTLERAEREGLADAFVQVVDALDNDAIGSQQQSPYTRIGISGVSSAAPSDMQWADKPFMVSVRESLLAK